MVRVEHFNALGTIATLIDPIAERWAGKDFAAVKEEQWDMVREGWCEAELPVAEGYFWCEAVNPYLTLAGAYKLVIRPPGQGTHTCRIWCNPAIVAGGFATQFCCQVLSHQFVITCLECIDVILLILHQVRQGSLIGQRSRRWLCVHANIHADDPLHKVRMLPQVLIAHQRAKIEDHECYISEV